MKTLINSASCLLLAACASLGAALPAQAQSSSRPQPVCVDQVGPFSYVIRVSNPAAAWGQIQLSNAKNDIFFQRYSKNHVFGNRINVQNLPDGQYALQVKIGRAVHNYTLDIHSTHERVARIGTVSTMAVVSAPTDRPSKP